MPELELAAGLLEHPIAELKRGAGPLGDRNELAGGQQPSRLVVPSNQRLQPDDPASGKLDLRLVVELELALIEGGTELVGDPNALMHPPIEVAAVEAVAIAPFVLGAVQRKVRLHHHIFRPGSLRGIERDADA